MARAVGGDTVESLEMWKGGLLTLKGYEERERERERDRTRNKVDAVRGITFDIIKGGIEKNHFSECSPEYTPSSVW